MDNLQACGVAASPAPNEAQASFGATRQET